ncbi:Gamma-glutamyltranspeptidase [Granulibacter bethesdensis CGDNIH4]|nr:Gamma-glutamyltranspeptidase [Granulibacter bethesdensis CGDNIH4]
MFQLPRSCPGWTILAVPAEADKSGMELPTGSIAIHHTGRHNCGMRDFHFPGRSPAIGGEGMAATSMPAATLAALDVLKSGGNAMDAAIAAVAVLSVIEPQATGIGGDCFCLYAPASGGVHALNGSGRSPAALTLEALEKQGIAVLEPTSAHAVTIPGSVAAWEALLTRFGTKGLDTLLQPAIALAEQGMRVHARVALDWSRNEDKLRNTGAYAFLPDGHAPSMGDLFRQPALAETLKVIAKQGARGFYEGAVAADMVATLRAKGGLHTEEDFAAGLTAPEFVTPIHRAWKNYEVWQCPPNGSGLLVLMMLGILEGFEHPPEGPLSALRLHRHAEAARMVYRDRDAFLADPAQVAVPLERLLSDSYLTALRGLIDDQKATTTLPAAGETLLPRHRDTVYLSVVDRYGNACSLINSLFNDFGSGILAGQSGVLLQNRGLGFRLERGHPNCVGPRKRPMHTIIPGMLMKDGQAVMPYGVMGGHFQPMGQTLFLTNMLEFGMDVQQALDCPRLFPFRGKLEIERGIPVEARTALTALGHDLEEIEFPHGGGQGIWIDRQRGVLLGGSDPRKDGLAMGY